MCAQHEKPSSNSLLEKTAEVTIALYFVQFFLRVLPQPLQRSQNEHHEGRSWNNESTRGRGQGDNLIRHRKGFPWRRYRTESFGWSSPTGVFSFVAHTLSPRNLLLQDSTPSTLKHQSVKCPAATTLPFPTFLRPQSLVGLRRVHE